MQVQSAHAIAECGCRECARVHAIAEIGSGCRECERAHAVAEKAEITTERGCERERAIADPADRERTSRVVNADIIDRRVRTSLSSDSLLSTS
jgi:hypothetical protein